MTQYSWLTSSVIVRVEGRDSERYLNARLTSKIQGLVAGQGFIGGCLTPQGRTQAFFCGACIEPQKYLMSCDGGDRSEILAAFKKYIVADRVEVSDLSEAYRVVHIMPPFPESALTFLGGAFEPMVELSTLTTPSGVAILRRRGELPGVDCILESSAASQLDRILKDSQAKEISAHLMRNCQIRAGVAAFPFELNEDYLFSEAGISHALSFQKGCYVGQEVVERIDALGKLPYRLRHIAVRSDSVPSIGSEIYDQGQSIGKIISIAASTVDAQEFYAFARIKNRKFESGDLLTLVPGIPGDGLVRILD